MRRPARLIARLIVVVALSAALVAATHERRAEAKTFDATTLAGFGITMLYVIPMASSLFATTINGTYLAYGEGSPRRWHVLGYAAGATEIVAGAAILAFGDGSSGTTILGVTPIVVGALSVAAAYFVDYPDDIVGGEARARTRKRTVVMPIVTADGAGAGIGIAGRF